VPLSYAMTSQNKLTLRKRLTRAGELKGLTMRSPGGFKTKIIEQLGASGVVMGSGEIYTSLERGLLDGFFYPIGSIPPMKFYDIIKNIVENVTFGAVSHAVAANKATWAKMPDDLKAMVQSCADYTATLIATYYDNDEQLAMDFLRGKGVEFYTFSPQELAKVEEMYSPLLKNWVSDMDKKGLAGKQTLDTLLKIKKKHSEKWK
jgi:TRAP-type C4-dicarboxylate transport system substrate-binding protein